MTAHVNATERVVVVGGSSGMGLALATALVAEGAEVTIAARSAERLAAAERALSGGPGKVRAIIADITEEDSIARLFTEVGPVDHVVTTAVDATGVYQPITELDPAVARRTLDAKLIGPALLAKHADIAPGGSLTFTSGIAAYRPGPGSSIIAAANGALASLAYALAIELSPVRVNVISPGWIDTPVWDTIAPDAKFERHRAMSSRLPVGRIGRPDEIAHAIRTLMANAFITGTVLHVDGGHRLV
ncbi:SDR family oxidoreductase [Nocardia sp. NPDC052566]|uniref:SDR family oxidoreductase n=1 Tax=Nocardia sp. NPDC052566 TaxID=3364330 RepID=UPI0037C958CC